MTKTAICLRFTINKPANLSVLRETRVPRKINNIYMVSFCDRRIYYISK